MTDSLHKFDETGKVNERRETSAERIVVEKHSRCQNIHQQGIGNKDRYQKHIGPSCLSLLFLPLFLSLFLSFLSPSLTCVRFPDENCSLSKTSE